MKTIEVLEEGQVFLLGARGPNKPPAAQIIADAALEVGMADDAITKRGSDTVQVALYGTAEEIDAWMDKLLERVNSKNTKLEINTQLGMLFEEGYFRYAIVYGISEPGKPTTDLETMIDFNMNEIGRMYPALMRAYFLRLESGVREHLTGVHKVVTEGKAYKDIKG